MLGGGRDSRIKLRFYPHLIARVYILFSLSISISIFVCISSPPLSNDFSIGARPWASKQVLSSAKRNTLPFLVRARPLHRLNMAAKYIISAVAGSFALAYIFDNLCADRKIFGGTTPKTVSNKEWWEETDKKFQAWPRTAGSPVVMNPISRQNFIVKSQAEP